MNPRNWRVRTRLNAILLIPVLVALGMGGFQVNNSLTTWRAARDAEKTALVVRAASVYGEALLNERDLTAEPLLTNQPNDPAVAQARAATDVAKKQFDRTVLDMPHTRIQEHRLSLFRAVEPKLTDLRKVAYSPQIETPDKTGGKGGPVATQEGYLLVQHPLMGFSNDLGFGTTNLTSYGRTVYTLQLAKAAESLQRSIGLELLIRPNKNAAIRAGQDTAFSSYAYLEGIANAETIAGGTQTNNAEFERVMKEQAVDAGKQLAAAGQQAAAAGKHFTAPPTQGGSAFDGMVAAISTGASPQKLADEGITPEAWMAAATAKFDGYTAVEKSLVDRAVSDAGELSDNARTDAITNGDHRADRTARRLRPGRHGGTADEPFHAHAAFGSLRHRRAATADAGRPALPDRTRPGRHPGPAHPHRLTRRDRRGRPRLRPGPPRGGQTRGRAGHAPWKRQRDLHQPVAPQPVADRGTADPHHHPGEQRGRSGPAGEPVQAGPSRHPYAAQRRESAGARG